MSKQQLPKVVVEILKEISQKVKEFNKTSEFNLVAKTSDDFLLKIYPQNHESIYFQINQYQIDDIYKPLDETTSKYTFIINVKSSNIIFSENERKGTMFQLSPKKELIMYLDKYLQTLNVIYLTVEAARKATIDLSDLFEIEQDEEEITHEPDQYESADKILPYTLKQLKVKDFQGIDETEIEDIPVDTQWIFLVGENGFGKTTILQAIFLGLHGTLDGNINLLEDKNCSIQVEYKSPEQSIINSIRDNKHPLTHLAAYGPGRLNLQGVKSENVEDRNNSVSYNLFNSDGFLFNINADLERLEYKDKKRFNLLKKAICTLIPNIADIKVNKETEQIEYIEQDLNNENQEVTYKPLPFRKLASGFKSIIALAGDIIVRLSKNQPEAKNPSQLKGIVIIDEIDLHLHPKFQRLLIGKFSEVFPQIQFIVSTHSPIPLLGAASNTIILKVNRTQAEGIKIEKVDIDLKNLTPNLVLTSGIFDMEEFTSIQNTDISQVRTEDSAKEMEENNRVKQALKVFEKSDENFPDELFIPTTTK
ncbi:putative AbiEii toxin of type IV toxin-antitoxin system [Arcicella aurantiaca]|uniref:Putative AbiEii toxin of type IV toxin-antitoxin system n=1 Tax=Arcicella aurantiaca TaxID=591202 RepID=A0A316ECN5_9BACT|nr:AAA family ATPase [Arcicella aurantiaca]PWK27135.1 putative AbiEii toxin of type IV toxin-antitoxin system [Arcicella aurantiaca]